LVAQRMSNESRTTSHLFWHLWVAQLSVLTPNKQLERTVVRRRGRVACASFHYAHAARWTLGRAAAELRR